MSARAKFGIVLLCFVLIVLLTVFVWPTRYRYDHTNIGGRRLPVRMDRVSGRTEVLSEGGWRSPEKLKSAKPRPIGLPYSEQEKIDGRGGIDPGYSDRWEVSLYNGTEWRVTELVVELSYKKFSRKYKLAGSIKPLSSAELSANLDTEVMIQREKNDYGNPEWYIVSALGYPPPGYKPELDYTYEEQANKEQARRRQAHIRRLITISSITAGAVLVVLGSGIVLYRRRRLRKPKVSGGDPRPMDTTGGS